MSLADHLLNRFLDRIFPSKPSVLDSPAEWVRDADIVFMDNTSYIRKIEVRNRREDFPKSHKNYVLYTPEEHEEFFFPVAAEVAQLVCQNRAVLRSFTCFSGSETELSLFRERYRAFLQHAYPVWMFFEKDARTFVVLSEGFPPFPLRYAPQTEKDRFEVSDAFCIFPQGVAFSSAQQAATAKDAKQHSLSLWFHEWPDELHFSFDPKDEDVNAIWTAARRVADMHDLNLAYPPEERCYLVDGSEE